MTVVKGPGRKRKGLRWSGIARRLPWSYRAIRRNLIEEDDGGCGVGLGGEGGDVRDGLWLSAPPCPNPSTARARLGEVEFLVVIAVAVVSTAGGTGEIR